MKNNAPKKDSDSSFTYLTNLFKKCYHFIAEIDKQITTNLSVAQIETRPVQSNGLWCCAILPTVLLTYSILYPVPPEYKLVAYISLALLFYCLLHILFMTVSCMVLEDPVQGDFVVPSLMSTVMLYVFLDRGLTFSLSLSLCTVYLFSLLLRMSIAKLPKTFTVGEAMVVLQAIVLYVVMAVVHTYEANNIDSEMDFVSAVVHTVLFAVCIIITGLYLLNDEHRNLRSLSNLVIGAAVFALIMLHSVLGVDCLLRIFSYIFLDAIHAKLLTFWLSLVLISVAVLMFRTKLAVKATTVTRKIFHVLASTVFLSGIICDEEMMKLAAGIGLGLLILVEALRKSRIQPISDVLQSIFLVYSDEKDAGAFAMTPLYLYCGLACPLVLCPPHEGRSLELLAGVLSVGVGDTAASWFGARYGFNKWTDSNKSLEGTTFNILAQVATVYALQLFSLLNVNYALVRTAFAATVSGLVEAKTDQVDNLILPLISILAFQMTYPLS